MKNNKYIYYINNIEVTRTEFKDKLAIVFGDNVNVTDFISMNVANYEKAEKEIKKMQRNHIALITQNGSYKIKIKQEDK